MPLSRSQIAKMARFTDMPTELHLMIYEALVDEKEPTKNSKDYRKDIVPLAPLLGTWRVLVQKTLYSSIKLRAEELPDLIDLAKSNPDLVTYIKELEITTVAGSSLDVEATQQKQEKRRKESEEKKLTFHKFLYLDHTLKKPGLNLGERIHFFKTTWDSVAGLLSLVPEQELHVESLSLSADDKVAGLFNEVCMPQYSFIPLQPTTLSPIPGFPLKKLTLTPKVLEHLELHQDAVRFIVNSYPDVEHLELQLDDCRFYRPFRRHIYDGLVETITGLSASHHNLTTLVLMYPSSTGEYRERSYKGLYVLTEVTSMTDPLADALCVLSQRLVKFHFYGRISVHLFGCGEDRFAWPELTDFLASFEAVDSFGNILLGPDDYDQHCDSCNCLCGCGNSDYVWDMQQPALEAIANAAYRNGEGFEEEFDLVRCVECRDVDIFSTDVKDPMVDELFHAASTAMLRMAKIQVWKFESVGEAVRFHFQAAKNKATVRSYYWKPPLEDTLIWEGRFPGLKRKVSKNDWEW